MLPSYLVRTFLQRHCAKFKAKFDEAHVEYLKSVPESCAEQVHPRPPSWFFLEWGRNREKVRERSKFVPSFGAGVTLWICAGAPRGGSQPSLAQALAQAPSAILFNWALQYVTKALAGSFCRFCIPSFVSFIFRLGRLGVKSRGSLPVLWRSSAEVKTPLFDSFALSRVFSVLAQQNREKYVVVVSHNFVFWFNNIFVTD